MDVYSTSDDNRNDGQPANKTCGHGAKANSRKVFIQICFSFIGVNLVNSLGNGQRFYTGNDEDRQYDRPKLKGVDFSKIWMHDRIHKVVWNIE